MDLPLQLIRATARRYDVADPTLAATLGIEPSDFFTWTRSHRWDAPSARVRVPPGAATTVQRDVLTACLSTSHLAAASGFTAAWLRGLRDRPPNPSTFVVSHGTRLPRIARTHGRLARWLEADDVEEVDAIPVLRAPAMVLSIAHLGPKAVRALLLDLVQAGLTTFEEVATKAAAAKPAAGTGHLDQMCEDLEGRLVESVFTDEVLEELRRRDYRPSDGAAPIDTPDGIGLLPDIVLCDWLVAVEPQGDRFHSTRTQRRRERRRIAQYAGTPWEHVPIDWRDWVEDREQAFDAIDAAIDLQLSRGIGVDLPPPPRRNR